MSQVPVFPEETLEKLAKDYREVLIGLGEDPDREGLVKTPMRVANPVEFFGGD